MATRKNNDDDDLLDTSSIESDKHPQNTATKERKASVGKNASNETNDGNEFLAEDERIIIGDESKQVTKLQTGQGPLDINPIERGYADRKYQGDTMSPIEEPSEPRMVINPAANNTATGRPLPNAEEIKRREGLDRQYAIDKLGQKEVPGTGGNPSTTTMTNKERKDNLAMTVDTALDWYCKGKSWIGEWLIISDSKLMKRQSEGKVPCDWAILYDSSTNEIMTLREFVNFGNQKIALACKTDPEFLAKLRPMLIAEFDRRNWIASPQESALFMVGGDLLNTGQKLAMVYFQMMNVMDRADKEFAEKKKTGWHFSPRDQYNSDRNFIPKPDKPQQPQSTPQPQREATPQSEVHKPETETHITPETDTVAEETGATPTTPVIQKDSITDEMAKLKHDLIAKDNEEAIKNGAKRNTTTSDTEVEILTTAPPALPPVEFTEPDN